LDGPARRKDCDFRGSMKQNLCPVDQARERLSFPFSSSAPAFRFELTMRNANGI